MKLLACYFLVMTCIGFAAMWIDKRKAIKHRWRISERSLLIIAALGGSIGVLAGMYLCRHKTRHLKFVIGVPVILALQLILFLLIVNSFRQRMESPAGVVRAQLEQLQRLDSDTVSSGFLFYQDQTETDQETENTENVLSAAALFYKDFSYRLENEEISGDHASVTATITNLDTHALARDLCLSLTRQRILSADMPGGSNPAGASGSPHTDGSSEDANSAASSGSSHTDGSSGNAQTNGSSGATYATDYYTLLTDTLSSHEYPLTETTVTFHLIPAGKSWQLSADHETQDALSSGLISALQDPDLVTPEEVLTMYMEQFAQMDAEAWRSYLEMDDIFATGSEQWAGQLDALYASLIAQYFDWTLDSCETSGSTAKAVLSVTSVDMPHVLSYYKDALIEYAGTADSITSPTEEQEDTSASFLYDCLQNHAQAGTLQVTLTLQNDGRVWQPDLSDDLTNAFLGDMNSALASLDETE